MFAFEGLEEKAELSDLASKMILSGAASGANLTLYEGRLLPNGLIVARYLHRNPDQIIPVRNAVVGQFDLPEERVVVLDREALYIVDPAYPKDIERFIRENETSKFYDKNLREITIQEVIEDTSDKIKWQMELDFVVDPRPEDDITKIAEFIAQVQAAGVEPDQHPLIFVRSKEPLARLPLGFISKPYFSLIKDKVAEFYSILYEDRIKRALDELVDKIPNLVNIRRKFECAVNEDFANKYLTRNQIKEFTSFEP